MSSICHQQVAKQGLTPGVAVRTCNDPTVAKLGIMHARPRSAALSKNKKVDAAGGIGSIAKGQERNGRSGGGGWGDQATVMSREYRQ